MDKRTNIHQNTGQNRDIKIGKGSFEKCATVQIFGDNSSKSKFDPGGN
jgi:hypothetical protein